jgi:hypothetical protein
MTPVEAIGVSAGVLTLLGVWVWCEVDARWRTYDGWMTSLLLAADLLLICVGFGPAFRIWRILFDRMALTQWAPHVGIFVQPRWPGETSGSGRSRKRSFTEPMPWTAGAVTH